MMIEIASTKPQSMLHVTREANMHPEEIAAVMGEAFGVIGAFLGRAGNKPTGAPLALYRDWHGQTIQVDVGFPVSPADAARAEGEVRAGQIPKGKALKDVHRGSHARLQETYESMEAYVKETGLKSREIAWEVYLNDPVSTPEDELMTEVYMPLV